MSFNKLSKKDRQLIIDQYSSNKPRKKVQQELSEFLKVTRRTIRSYAKELNLGIKASELVDDKIITYDIETSRIKAYVWSTGKQYINHLQTRSETTIISIAWKYIGQDKVKHLTWDEDHCDKKMLEVFLKEYNSASMVIGQNNNSFDNKLINTRAAKHRLFVDRYVKSFDIYRMAKRYFRLPSYSMAYMAKYFGLTLKQSHEGIHMWDMIEDGTEKEQKEYLKKMVDYNKGDIVTTEELYMTLKPYFGSVTNNAVKQGLPKWACPVSGSTDIKLLKTIFTEQGTVQRILFCEKSQHQYKVSNKSYMDFLQRRMIG
tara:strand:+ start:35066 stop:36010 length:945 start_codon:yes stop_codon:yes gene_type:complete